MRNHVETQAYIKLRRKICVIAGKHIVRGKKCNTLKEKPSKLVNLILHPGHSRPFLDALQP
jgi:hypothetical protein